MHDGPLVAQLPQVADRVQQVLLVPAFDGVFRGNAAGSIVHGALPWWRQPGAGDYLMGISLALDGGLTHAC